MSFIDPTRYESIAEPKQWNTNGSDHLIDGIPSDLNGRLITNEHAIPQQGELQFYDAPNASTSWQKQIESEDTIDAALEVFDAEVAEHAENVNQAYAQSGVTKAQRAALKAAVHDLLDRTLRIIHSEHQFTCLREDYECGHRYSIISFRTTVAEIQASAESVITRINNLPTAAEEHRIPQG